MARSEAQKAADKKYRESNKGKDVSWGTKFKIEEAAQIDAVISESGMNRAEFIRWAIARFKEKSVD